MTVDIRRGSPQFPTLTESVLSSTQEAMNVAIQTLQSHKDAWVLLTIDDRVAILDDLIKDFAAIAPRWVAGSLQAKGVREDAPAAAEEWVLGPWPILKNLSQLRQSLIDIKNIGHPRIPGPVTTLPDGQVVAQVYPQTLYDRLFSNGVTAEIWMEPGVTVEELPKTQALAYQEQKHQGKVALVLGAGNVSSIGPMDILYKLFVEDQVVVLKTNPVNVYLGPLIEESFRALIELGFLHVVYGGAEEGAYLCNHPEIDEIHITGSDKTFDAIVFGSGRGGDTSKTERRPFLTKRVS